MRTRPLPAARGLASTLAALVLLSLALSPTAAQAQSTVKPSEAQFQLYAEGYEAFKAGDYTKAVDLFRASLHLGELNITYLNLGRALFKLDRCEEAAEAYDKADRAPRIADPPPQVVQDKTREYREDLKTCLAALVVECVGGPGMKVTIGDRAPIECTGKPIALPPGEYDVQGERAGTTYEGRVTLKPMERATLSLGKGAGKPSGEVRKIEGGKVKQPAGPPRHSVLLGARVGSLLSGSGEFVVDAKFSGESSSATRTLTEAGALAVNGYGLLTLGELLAVGGGVWFIPAVNITVDDEQGATFGESNELDLNAMATLSVPTGAIEYFLIAEGGLSVLGAPSGSDAKEPYTGFNVGAGGGLMIRIGGFRLSSDVRLQNVNLSRSFSQEGIDLTEKLNTTRIMIDFGLALGI